jgi:hypothetical protein
MTHINETLWQRLQSFAINDPEAGLTFTQRLANENNWSLSYAERVVEEYKKFLYLCCTGDEPATPSDAVDQAWHLHMIYTKSYWEELCGQVLTKPLHHQPTKGGITEAAKFDYQYQLTLQRYAEEFGEEAPTDIWLAPERRFKETNFKRVNADKYVVLPRKLLRYLSIVIVAVAGVIHTAISGQLAPLIIALFFSVVLLAFEINGGGGSGCSGGSCGGGCGGDSGCGSGCGGGGCGGGCGGD